MLFDFREFINELRNSDNEQYRETIETYEQFYGPIPNDYKELAFYKEYLSQFKPIKYKVPEECKHDYDFDLLLVLIAASFSTNYDFVFTNGCFIGELPELNIYASSDGKKVVIPVSEQCVFQLKRMFEIYFEENLNLQPLTLMDYFKHDSIEEKRKLRIQNYNNLVAEADYFSNTLAKQNNEPEGKKPDFNNEFTNDFPE